MDTSDPEIRFDDEGVCDHCRRYLVRVNTRSYLQRRRPDALAEIVREIQRAGRGRPYDCIIGVSGGVDSTYVAHKTKELGLRPLAVHLDNGWNSELAVSNIEKALTKLSIDLHTHVLDWDEFRDLQLAFLKASTPDAEVPTDHAIVAVLHKVAAQHRVRYIIGGTNTATEGGGVAAWTQGHGDWRYIRSIHRRFGTKPLKTFPHYGPLRFAYHTMIRGIRWISLLDFLDYDKQRAMDLLSGQLGWRPYGGKHYESVYTRFYQGVLLPEKFGFDKRRLHLSSLIWSGQMSRDEAVREIQRSDYPESLKSEDRAYVAKKLGLTSAEMDEILTAPPRTFWDYPSYKKSFQRMPQIRTLYHQIKVR